MFKNLEDKILSALREWQPKPTLCSKASKVKMRNVTSGVVDISVLLTMSFVYAILT